MAPVACEYVIETLSTWMSFLSETIQFECLRRRFFNDVLMRAVRDNLWHQWHASM